MGIISVDEQELEKFIRRVFRNEMAGLKFVPSATNSVEDKDPDDDDESAGVIGRGKKKKKKEKTTKVAAAVGKKRGKKRGKRAVATAALKAKTREQILSVLMQRGPMRVTQIVEITGISQSSINKYLNQMMEERIVARLQEEGNRILYKAVHDGRVGRKTAEKAAVKTRESERPAAGGASVAA
jgi:DNA-binding transcriptional ArsR family regulator